MESFHVDEDGHCVKLSCLHPVPHLTLSWPHSHTVFRFTVFCRIKC